MSSHSLRGYQILERDGAWYFTHTGEATVATWKNRPCGHCGLHNTPEGHDGCIGTLPNVINACCGHGISDDAYIIFNDNTELRGTAAIKTMHRE